MILQLIFNTLKAGKNLEVIRYIFYFDFSKKVLRNLIFSKPNFEFPKLNSGYSFPMLIHIFGKEMKNQLKPRRFQVLKFP